MAGILQDLLRAKEPIFSLSIRQLERASGLEGRDARLIGDIALKMRSNIEALGLDPLDTTGRELYAALMSRIATDDTRIAKMIGGDDPDNVRQMIPLVIQTVESMEIPRDCWVLKRSVAKKLLKNMPPKHLMKHLGHKSIDSMLKHENIDELYVVLRSSEGQKWLDSFIDSMKSVSPSDFETRAVSVIQLSERFEPLTKAFVDHKLHHIIHSKEMGIVATTSVYDGRRPGITLKTLLLLLHYISEVRLYSAYFKLRQVQPNFGSIVAEMLTSDPNTAAEMAGQKVHWRVVQRYLGKHDEAHPDLSTPHVQPEDLRWRDVEDTLAAFDPAMDFWISQAYVGKMFDKNILTFNLIDTVFSYADSKKFSDAYDYHFRESLWNELFGRYMGARNLREQVMMQLESPMIDPEEI